MRRPKNGPAIALIFATLLLSPARLAAETAYLTPSADTALLEHYPLNNTGAELYLNSGTTQIFTKNRASPVATRFMKPEASNERPGSSHEVFHPRTLPTRQLPQRG